jgi:hypothetical protein
MLSSSINLQWPPFIQRAASDILTDYGPFVFGNRPVRTRMPGGVGAGGEKLPATRFGDSFSVVAFVESRLGNVLVTAYAQNVESPFLYQGSKVHRAFQQNPPNSV